MAWVPLAQAGVKALAADSAKAFGVDGAASTRGSGLDGSGWSINFGSGSQEIKQSQNKADAGDPSYSGVPVGGLSQWLIPAGIAAAIVGFVIWKRRKKKAH